MAHTKQAWSARLSRAVGVSLVLASLAAVPVGTVGYLAWRDLQASAAEVDATARIGTETAALIQLIELRFSVIDERSWGSGVTRIEELGVPLEVTVAVSGIDFLAEHRTSVESVDELVASAGLARIAQGVEAARAASTLSASTAAYSDVEAELGALADTRFVDLINQTAALRNGDELAEAVLALEASVVARNSQARQTEHFFGPIVLRIEPVDEDIVGLIAERGIHDDALERVDRLSARSSRAGEQLAALRSSEDLARFRAAAELLVEEALRGELSTEPLTLASLLEDSERFFAVAGSSREAARVHDSLIDVTSAGVTNLSARLGQQASDDRGRVLQIVGLFGLLGFCAIFVAGRLIARPLRALAGSALALSEGDSSQVVTPSGPREIRVAARALNEAANHLGLVERQARALAGGDLNNGDLDRSTPGLLGSDIQQAVSTLATSLATQERFRRELAHKAGHDSLTDLPNRSASLSYLKSALADLDKDGSALAVFFIDLDGFKTINDQHGHQAGDAVLAIVARRLESEARESDHVGRFGGDEFLVVSRPVVGLEDATEVADRLREAVSQPISVGSTEVRVGASVGVALADSKVDQDELLRDADMALYKAKEDGRGKTRHCDAELSAALLHERAFTEAIVDGLRHGEFTVHYQLIVEPDTENVRSLEALIRWDRPGFGRQDADSFISIADRSELIVELDCFVLAQVAAQLAVWSDHPSLAETPVSVNISGRHLAGGMLVDNVMNELEANSLDPRRLILEITESTLLNNLDDGPDQLQVLRDQGVAIAIDDFGTGYTSLAHLGTLPIDILKIDPTVTSVLRSSQQDERLVKLIIDTGHFLGAKLIAEGVETAYQAERLAELGTDDLQGYYFGKPVPPEVIADHAVGQRDDHGLTAPAL